MTIMKKLLLIAVISVTSIGMCYSGPISYGLKGGINFSNLGGSDWDVNSYYKTSFHGGLFLDISLLGLVGVETGAYYSRKGYVDITQTEEGVILQESDYTYNYIDVPVLLRFKPIPLVSLFAGPQASLLLNHSNVIIDAEGNESTDNVEYEFNDFDFAVVIGTHTNLPFGVFITASYEIGLLPLYTDNQKINNRVIKISLGYKF